MSRTTVVHVFSGDLWAGAEVMISHLLPALRRFDVNVVALSLNEGTLTERLRQAGIETHVIEESGRSFGGLALRARVLLRQQKDVILHAHRYKENLLAWVLSRWLGARALIATQHGLPEPIPVGTRLRTRAVGLLDQWLLKSRFTRVVAVSEEMRRELVGRLGFEADRLAVIWNGVPVPAAGPGDVPRRQGSLRVGTVGRLVPVKGLELAVETAAVLRQDPGHVRVSILGDGPLRESLRQHAETLGVLDCLDLKPAEPDPLAFYRSLDVYLNTSLHEGMPLSILEAMACGKPVVAPRVGGIPEAVTDGREGFLVDGRDPSEFAARCRMLLSDRVLRETMGARARERVRSRFSVCGMAEAYAALYEGCGA